MTSENIEFSQAALERGRLLFARPWEFLLGVPSMKFLPEEGPTEICFAGRSNVGKSSLINALLGQKGIARTSNTPGRTQELNFFIPAGFEEEEAPPVAIVDMPGYGYAKAPKSRVEAWTKVVFSYLRGRSTLRRVFVLIDARHGIKDNDEEVIDMLDTAAVSYQIVLTKTDKLKPPAVKKLIEATQKRIAKRAAAHPRLIITSSQKNEGIDKLRAEIAELIERS